MLQFLPYILLFLREFFSRFRLSHVKSRLTVDHVFSFKTFPVFFCLYSMAVINPLNVARLLMAEYRMCQESPLTDHEKELTNYLKDLIHSCPNIATLNVGVSTDLVFEHELVDRSISDEDMEILFGEDGADLGNSQSQAVSSLHSEYHTPTPEDQADEVVSLQYKTNAVKYWRERNGEPRKKRLKWTAVKVNYPKLKHRKTLYTWEAQVDKGESSRLEKLKSIFHAALKAFQEAKEQRIIIHDMDLRRWALIANAEVGLQNFVASASWVDRFKKKLDIVSRKITKSVTTGFEEEQSVLHARRDEFIKTARPYLENRGPESFYNSDQSGCPREIHSGRTLTTKGEKHVPGRVQSVNALTHSYTIQPVISADGNIMPRLLVCLQEVKRVFGKQVIKTMLRARNIHAMASKSGKLTKSHVAS